MDSKFCVQIITMKDSFYVWVGPTGDTSMGNLSLALMSAADRSTPAVSNLFGAGTSGDAADNLAERLTKRSGQVCYVSYNLPTRNVLLAEVVQREIVKKLVSLGVFASK